MQWWSCHDLCALDCRIQLHMWIYASVSSSSRSRREKNLRRIVTNGATVITELYQSCDLGRRKRDADENIREMHSHTVWRVVHQHRGLLFNASADTKYHRNEIAHFHISAFISFSLFDRPGNSYVSINCVKCALHSVYWHMGVCWWALYSYKAHIHLF